MFLIKFLYKFYMVISLEHSAFLRLYEETKDKLFMKESGKYALDTEVINEYIRNSCDENIKELLTFVFDNIIYIDFNTFLDKFVGVLNNINVAHRVDYNFDSNKIIDVVILIPGFNIMKSTMWLSLIIYHFLPENMRLIEICKNVVDFYDYMTDMGEEDSHTIALIADDCAYSGSQLSTIIIPDNVCTFKLVNKVYPIVPYISYAAQQKFYDQYSLVCEKYVGRCKRKIPKYLIFSNSITYIDNIFAIAAKKNFNIFEKDIFYMTKEDHAKKIKYNSKKVIINTFIRDILVMSYSGLMIYFDHKIADQLSTIQYFLNYSTILNNVYIAKLDLNDSTYLFSKLVALENKNIVFDRGYNIAEFYNEIPIENFKFYKCDASGSKKYYEIIKSCTGKQYLSNPTYANSEDYDLNDMPVYICPKTFYKCPGFYSHGDKSLKELTIQSLTEYGYYLIKLRKMQEKESEVDINKSSDVPIVDGYETKYLNAKKQYIISKNSLKK